ncbi:MAG: response regulator [Proteobacteria bacterium]|nr:response regulator [Pseudomonadota bacterium]
MPKKVLIVEDNDLNLKLFRDLLEAHDINVVETREGKLAVETALREAPDLIIMDIQLPGVSGLDIIREMKAVPQLVNTPIIAVTAFAMRDDEENILSSGCEAYIAKPISIGPFLNTIEKYINKDAPQKAAQ